MTSQSSVPSPALHSTTPSHSQKDYAAAFGALQSQYGLGGLPTPSLPKTDSNTQKWYKWGKSRSSSTTSLIQSATRSDTTSSPSQCTVPTQGTLTESELRFSKATAAYGNVGARLTSPFRS